ncbi:hypothetical protein D1007_10732 [Hordeum vulgare]|nr:hypothetical protein D1007_10732 [Hordeum vulgare]
MGQPRWWLWLLEGTDVALCSLLGWSRGSMDVVTVFGERMARIDGEATLGARGRVSVGGAGWRFSRPPSPGSRPTWLRAGARARAYLGSARGESEFTLRFGNQSHSTMDTPSPSPQADASSVTAAPDAAAELPASNTVETRLRAPASDETTTLPLAAIPPNPHVSSSSSTPPASLPTTVTSVVDFKLALDGTNFQRWRNYVTLLLACYHAEDHVREVSVRRLDDPAWRDDDNTVVL